VIRLADGLVLLPIPGGTCVLGNREPGGRPPAREFSVSGFYMAACETTTRQYAQYLQEIGAENLVDYPQFERRAGRIRPRPGLDNHPVTNVTFSDGQAYARWLSGKTGLTLRLPSETEWEYAARGGIRHGPFPWGWGDPKGRANFDSAGTCPVGRYPPNPFGLCDMAGNVFEWCVAESRPGRPSELQPARGGSWAERDPNLLRVFHRTEFPSGYRNRDAGFRLVMTPQSPEIVP
jgi:formylglycine-generating enzyme required for sulfatase activity